MKKQKFTKDQRIVYLARIKLATGFCKKDIELINFEYFPVSRANRYNSVDSSVLFKHKEKMYELYSGYSGFYSERIECCVCEVIN